MGLQRSELSSEQSPVLDALVAEQNRLRQVFMPKCSAAVESSLRLSLGMQSGTTVEQKSALPRIGYHVV
jgi:hypothetical protein|eukprot:SAG25_NODE_30_length_20554_cov_36.028694_21_plen_69_part_00